MKRTQLARAIGAALIVAGASACSEHLYDLGGGALAPNEPSSSAIVIGVAPAPPGETPDSAGTPVGETGTTKTEVSASVSDQAMPVPGQANDHSNVARLPSQKAGSEDAVWTVDAAKSANSGEGKR